MTLNLTFWLPALVAGVISALLSFYLIKLAIKKSIFIPPLRERDTHTTPIPRVGGIAIVAAFLLVSVTLGLFYPEWLNFSPEKVAGFDKNLLGVLVGVVILSVVNFKDDYRSLPWQYRLIAQIVAALVIYWSGIHIEWVTNPFGDKIILENIAWALVVIWLVGLSNVTNMLDGVDGLAGSVSAITLAILFFLSVSPDVNQLPNALLATIALGALVGFLPFNFSPAKAFLGDTGSVFLGFIIGILAIISGGKVATTFLVLAIPFIDALVVISLRLLSGRSPFLPDQLHLHHQMTKIGLRPWQITIIFSLISLIFGLIALNTQILGQLNLAVSAAGIIILFIIYYLIRQYRR